jgi:hypothetical protein
MRWVEHVALMGETRNAYNILVAKPERKRPDGRTRQRWEENIRMILAEIGWEGVNCIYLARNRDQWRSLVKAVMNLRFL